MAKRSPLYSKEEDEFIRRRGKELSEGGNGIPWTKFSREIKQKCGTRRNPNALRAHYYRLEQLSNGEGATAFQNTMLERYRRSTERFLARVTKELGKKELLEKMVEDLKAELMRLRKEARPALIMYHSVLRAQKRAQGRTVEHSQD